MAAQQIPSGKQGLRAGADNDSRASQRFFGRNSPAKRRDLRRNGPVGVQFPFYTLEYAEGRRMTAAASRHISVLGREAVEMLAPRDGGIYVDATFGAGGYSRMILETDGTRVIGIDRDRSAIAGGFDLVDQSRGRLTLVEDRFSNLAEVCAAQGIDAVDGVVMDVGVSSMQLDQAERGFSFRLGGPLDMRMGHDGPTAADVVAKASEADLANIIDIFGEERHSRGVARAIVAARKEAPITTTKALADIVGKVVRSKPNEIHPATRTFQALRIFVNAELDELHLALSAAEHVLKPRGRLAWCRFIRWKTASSRISLTSAASPAADRGICLRSRRPRRAFRS
jgi:16S rRNA (cytosine1402-N4)-methyltransferase